MESIGMAARRAHAVDTLDDTSLVALALGHDEEAVRAIIKRHNQRLFRTARAVVRDDAEAEDVVQEAYVRAFAHLDRFRGDSALSTWLTRIALNEALGRMRRRRPTVGLDRIDAEMGPQARVLVFPSPSAGPDPEAETARGQIRQMLERVVDELPDIFRTVFVLRDIEDLTTEETADQLGIKPETVKTRLHRARKLMRGAFEREFAATLSSVFPFDGARCVQMSERVLGRLRQAQANAK